MQYKQDKLSDIEQQPPFDESIKQYTTSKLEGAAKPTKTSYNLDKVSSGTLDNRFGI